MHLTMQFAWAEIVCLVLDESDIVLTVNRLPLRVHTFQLPIDLSILACIGWPLSCMVFIVQAIPLKVRAFDNVIAHG